jgi:hypothetical protein
MVREIDLTRDAPKTHQDRDKRNRIERQKVRVKDAKTHRDLQNAMLGVLDLLADEL